MNYEICPNEITNCTETMKMFNLLYKSSEYFTCLIIIVIYTEIFPIQLIYNRYCTKLKTEM